MPPKKKDKKAKKNAEPDPGEDPEIFLAQYKKFCKLTAIPECPQVLETFADDEKKAEFENSKQFVIHPAEPTDKTEPRLGPGGTRALATAIMGIGPGMTTPFKVVKSLRIWWSNVGDDGTAALSELLRLGGAEIQINYLELWDNNIGPTGALALGRSLMVGNNRSLVTLNLNFNGGIGSEGAAALCKGLRTNSTLKQLHLQYCNLDAEAGQPLGEMLSHAKMGLTVLDLQGNHLGGQGLLELCPGLEKNRTLERLNLADNDIDDKDVDALSQLNVVLMLPNVALSKISLLHNRIGEAGAQALLPALAPENTRIQQFEVPDTLPTPLFDALFRGGGGGKKGKKKGKKKKK